MTIWIDEHIAPSIAKFITLTLKVSCLHISEVIGNQSTDLEIFVAAAKADAIIVTKDSDFIELYSTHGAPPKIILLQCGNISNKDLKHLLAEKLAVALNEVSHNDFTLIN